MSQKYTRIGMGLAVVSVMAAVLLPEQKAAPKAPSRKKGPAPPPSQAGRRPPPVRRPREDDGVTDAFTQPLDTSKLPKMKRVAGIRADSLRALPGPDELFAPDDPFFQDEAVIAPEAAEVEEKAAPETPVYSAPPPPAPVTKPPEKRGILSRIFQKPGGGRPASLDAVLEAAQAEERAYKQLVVRALLRYSPASSFARLGLAPLEDEDVVEALTAARAAAGLDDSAAAEGFAGTASAMLVDIVDRVVRVLDEGSKSKNSTEAAAAVVAALDETVVFIKATGDLFGRMYAGVVVEPVVYNGRAKRGRLEDAYLLYCKAAMNVADMLAQAAGEAEAAGDARMEDLGRVL